MYWRSRPVLVTGAGGFIGSHLAEALVQRGATVRAFVHYNALNSSGWLEQSAVKGEMEIIPGDLRDRDSVARAMKGVDTVFHLGALIAIPYSYNAPISYVSTNIEGTLNVLQAVRELQIQRLVHTSTSEVYGTARYVPIDEAHPLQGQSPYSATKIGADKLVEAFHLSFGVPAVTVRPFNTFGPRQSIRAIIPTIITQCLAGTAIRLGRLDTTRDLNYVSDTVEGFLLAACKSEAIGKTFNIGSGHEIAVGELVEVIGRMSGSRISIVQETGRTRPENSEVERLVADATLARSVLGWHPEIGFVAGLEKTIEWFRPRIGSYRSDTYIL